WMNDAEVTRTLLAYRPYNLRAEEEYIEKIMQSEHDLVLGIAVRADDRLIGALGLHQMDFRHRQTSFGIVIGEKSDWGKGYGTEATFLIVKPSFETLNLNRVWLHVFEHNLSGLRAYEKVGFRREGVLRQSSFSQGRYWDTISMAILREDWDARKSKEPV